MDPNDKIGPSGFGMVNYVAQGSSLPHRINFENDSSATAPAQQVTITDQLNANLDWTSFALTEIGFGDNLIAVPSGSQYFETAVPMTYNGRDFEVQIAAGIDLTTGKIFANFYSIDPITSLPPDVLTGFLPPEDGTGRGMGYFSYTIKPKAGLPTGREIRNIALIVFDGQTAIATNQIDPHDASKGTDPAKEALVTIDAGKPSSAVWTLAPTRTAPSFLVGWNGTDDVGGSGIGSYDIYVSTDGGSYALWQDRTAAASATFDGAAGHTYRFYSIARDNVGNMEAAPTTPDTVTQVVDGLAVTGVAMDASGVSVRFNKTLDTSVLNLYATETGGQGPADVILSGTTTGAVAGSVVLDNDLAGLRFVKTGGVLASDTYTLTLRSAADGFIGTNGTLLDGDNDGTPGGDFVSFNDTFSGSAASATNWRIPTWVSTTDGTFLGRTQFRTSQNAPLPETNGGNAVIKLESYNPTGFSFYGTDLISQQSFSVQPGQGLHISVRAEIDTPVTAGTVGGIFLYSLKEGSNTLHDEIDFELVGTHPNEVQTNIYGNEPLGTGHPQWTALPGGATIGDYHTYEIKWFGDRVLWYVDGALIRTATANIPTGPMYLHLNMWAPGTGPTGWPEAYSGDIQPTGSPASNTVWSMRVDSVSVLPIVDAPARIVSLPDIVRGPGQPVDIPATASGIPIRLNDGTDVESLSFTLAYDPALLTIGAVTPSASLPAGSQVTTDLTTPGQLTVTMNFASPLGAGPKDLVSLAAAIPTTAPYRAKQVLDFTSITLNGGALAVIADDAVQLIAYFGDTTGNGSYSSLDGQRVLRQSVGLDSGFAAFPLADPVLVADITGNSAISSLDATRILQEVVGIDRPEIPPLVGITITGPVADPFVSIPTNLTGKPGDVFTAPVLIDNADGLESADFTLNYDAMLLDVVAVRNGSVMSGAMLITNPSPVTSATGTITFGLVLTKPRLAGSGSLLEIDFRIKESAVPGATALNLTQVVLNEGLLVLTPLPLPGQDPTDGVLTIQPIIVNHAPAGTDRTVTLRADASYIFTVADFGFSDPSDTPANTLLAVKITSVPLTGRLTNNGVAVRAGTFIPVADIAGGKLVFTPAKGSGAPSASFGFQVQDNGGSANGGIDLDQSPNTLTLNVIPAGTATRLFAVLIDDTGSSATDRITAHVISPRGLVSLSGRLDESLSANLLPLVQPDGSFILNAAFLQSLTGAPLLDGKHILHLLAVDRAGSKTRLDFAFTLDTRGACFLGER